MSKRPELPEKLKANQDDTWDTIHHINALIDHAKWREKESAIGDIHHIAMHQDIYAGIEKLRARLFPLEAEEPKPQEPEERETLTEAERLYKGMKIMNDLLPTMEQAARALMPKDEPDPNIEPPEFDNVVEGLSRKADPEDGPRCSHCSGITLETKEFLGEKCAECGCIENLRGKPGDEYEKALDKLEAEIEKRIDFWEDVLKGKRS